MVTYSRFAVFICYDKKMGEGEFFQPLTSRDKISVIVYRTGIVLSMFLLIAGAFLSLYGVQSRGHISEVANALLLLLYAAVGMSVFLIHLYVSKFHRALKTLYFIAMLALIILFVSGKGSAYDVLISETYGPLLLLPLAGCLGFITAKEAFCFRLVEGYLLSIIMPLYLVILAAGAFTDKGASYGLILIAAMFALFTFRKVFVPLHYDIGDKSAYT
jgi:uncharacterized integral membrane protein